MPRLQVRLRTIAITILIIALSSALVVQQQRMMTLAARLEAMEQELEVARRVAAIREHMAAQAVAQVRAQVARESGDRQDSSRNDPGDTAKGRPKR